jgi:hypothetical protein
MKMKMVAKGVVLGLTLKMMMSTRKRSSEQNGGGGEGVGGLVIEKRLMIARAESGALSLSLL